MPDDQQTAATTPQPPGWKRRILCKLIRCGIIVILIWAGYLTVEHFRWRHALDQWKREMEPKGECFDIAQIALPPHPLPQSYIRLTNATAKLPESPVPMWKLSPMNYV